jgi:DNA repair exonuclease SbcCD ATPase subunit
MNKNKKLISIFVLSFLAQPFEASAWYIIQWGKNLWQAGKNKGLCSAFSVVEKALRSYSLYMENKGLVNSFYKEDQEDHYKRWEKQPLPEELVQSRKEERKSFLQKLKNLFQEDREKKEIAEKKIKSENEMIESEISEINKNIELSREKIENIKKNSENILQEESKRREIASAQETIKELELDKIRLEDKIGLTNKEFIKREEKINSLIKEKNSVLEELQSLEKMITDHSHSSKYQEALEFQEAREYEASDEKLRDIKYSMKKYKEERDTILEEIKNMDKSHENISSKIKKIEEERSFFERKEDKKARIDSLIVQRNKVDSEIAGLKEMLEDRDREINKLEKDKNDIELKTARLQNLYKESPSLRDKYFGKGVAHGPIAGEYYSILHKQNQYISKKKNLDVKLKSLDLQILGQKPILEKEIAIKERENEKLKNLEKEIEKLNEKNNKKIDSLNIKKEDLDRYISGFFTRDYLKRAQLASEEEKQKKLQLLAEIRHLEDKRTILLEKKNKIELNEKIRKKFEDFGDIGKTLLEKRNKSDEELKELRRWITEPNKNVLEGEIEKEILQLFKEKTDEILSDLSDLKETFSLIDEIKEDIQEREKIVEELGKKYAPSTLEKAIAYQYSLNGIEDWIDDIKTFPESHVNKHVIAYDLAHRFGSKAEWEGCLFGGSKQIQGCGVFGKVAFTPSEKSCLIEHYEKIKEKTEDPRSIRKKCFSTSQKEAPSRDTAVQSSYADIAAASTAGFLLPSSTYDLQNVWKTISQPGGADTSSLLSSVADGALSVFADMSNPRYAALFRILRLAKRSYFNAEHLNANDLADGIRIVNELLTENSCSRGREN